MTRTLEAGPVTARLAVRRSLVRMDMLHLGVQVDDDVVNAIVRAIQIQRGDWNPADHPRNPAGSVGGGKFRSLTARIADALKTRKKDGTGDPLEGFDREQLRKTAVKLGLKLRRGASEAEIKKMLLDHADAGHPLDEPKPKAPDAADPKAPSLEVELDALIKDNNRKLTRPATKHLKEAVAYLGHGSPDLALDRLKKAKVEQEYSRPGTKVPFIDDFIERLTPKPKTTKKAAPAKKVAAPSAPTPQPAVKKAAPAKKATPLSALGADGKPIPLPSKEYRDRAILGDKEYDRRQAAKKAAPAKRVPAKSAVIRDLLAADDATIETALRDVYEGKFGPYTTKVKVHITRAGTKVDSRGRERQIEASIGVDGDIYDSAGNKIGDFGRSITATTVHYHDGTIRREIWAEHKVVQLDDKTHQGKGFGGEFNRRAIDWYRTSGVHGISQNDQNGYVWASQGFNFTGGVVPAHTVESLRELVADLRAGSTKNKYGETIPKQLRDAPNLAAQLATAEDVLARLQSTKPGEPGYPTAYELSQIGRQSGQRGKTVLWLGRHLHVSADELVLNPDEGEVLSQ